jgi:ATP-dependent Clp protease adaptor protein ClpS
MSTDTLEDIKIDEKIEKKAGDPAKYKVIMLNDDVTPMEWVVGLLTTVFKHSSQTAHDIMLTIHTEGSAVVGIYTHEVAEQKLVEAIAASREQGFPLQLRAEKE